MKLVPLTRGMFAVVDDCDAERVLAHNWQAVECDKHWYARRTTTKEERAEGLPTVQYMHSLITGFALTDHISGVTLDNRRGNLREATHPQNSQNATKRDDVRSTKYKGVVPYKPTGLWRAYITHEGRSRHIGYYRLEIAAASAYDHKARELFGEYARLNFPDGLSAPDQALVMADWADTESRKRRRTRAALN